MLLKFGFYLVDFPDSQKNKLLQIISKLTSVGIRCFMLTDIPAELFREQDSQYCIIQGFDAHAADDEAINFVDRKDIDLLISNIPAAIKDAQNESKIPVIDINELLKTLQDKMDTGLPIAGEILIRYFNDVPTSDLYAIYDVGTNNIQAVWAEIEGEKIKVIHRASRISAMGKNIKDKKLTQEGINRAKRILKDFLDLSQFITENIIVVGTSSSRESQNIDFLINWLKSRYDIEYRIISEEQEAELTGVANRKLFSEFPEIILFDIGGGSTEFIYYKGEELIYLSSLKLGIRRLENYVSNNRSNKKEHIRHTLSRLPRDILLSPVLIGIGGTVTNISAVKQKLVYYDSEAVHKSKLNIDDIEHYLQSFSRMSPAEIAELMPFEPLRAKVITTGLLIVREIMKYFGQEQIYVSDFGILFGILKQIADGS